MLRLYKIKHWIAKMCCNDLKKYDKKPLNTEVIIKENGIYHKINISLIEPYVVGLN